MIKIGGRVGFDKIEEIEERFKSIDFPIELALPWIYQDMWKKIEHRLNEIIEYFLSKKIEILSIHATQGRINEPSFIKWGRDTLEIAKKLHVKFITIHPNNIKTQRTYHQQQALKNIKKVDSNNIFSLETFSGKNRLFTPKDIMKYRLPMTLDTAHIYSKEEIKQIIKNYHNNISTIHLSAIGNSEHHLPIDNFCIKVVDLLKKHKWSGNIILEYLPWHHYRIRNDIKQLNDYIFNDKKINLLPVNDDFKNKPECYGYNLDGSN